jgi:hypothetical protein
MRKIFVGAYVALAVAMIVFVAVYADRIRAILTGKGVGG